MGVAGPGVTGTGGYEQRQCAHATADVPDIASLPRPRQENDPAGGLFLFGACFRRTGGSWSRDSGRATWGGV